MLHTGSIRVLIVGSVAEFGVAGDPVTRKLAVVG